MIPAPIVDIVIRLREVDEPDGKLFRELLVDSLWEMDMTLREFNDLLGGGAYSWLRRQSAPYKLVMKPTLLYLAEKIEEKRNTQSTSVVIDRPSRGEASCKNPICSHEWEFVDPNGGRGPERCPNCGCDWMNLSWFSDES